MRSLLLVAAFAQAASASSMTVTGGVIDVRSRWTADGDRIITEATVQTDTGPVVVSQLGGTVDGLTMRSFPGPEHLVTGMHVAVAARVAKDLSQRTHVVVEDVKVMAYPPGYVRTGPTKANHYLYWESGCVFITLDEAGAMQVPGDLEFQAIDRSIAAWNNGSASCSYMQLMSDGRKPVEVGRDNVNVIKFREVSWCRPATKDDPARCHPESAAGITVATYVDDASSSRDGAIVDADIELNGVNFTIAVDGQTTGTASCVAELQNTLTHELGHLLGLEHTCLAPGDDPRIDHEGRPVPQCSQASNEQQEATMFNFQECGETKKETLTPDDIAGVCGIYPLAMSPNTCERVGENGGCCQSGGGPSGPLTIAGILLLTRFWRRRS